MTNPLLDQIEDERRMVERKGRTFVITGPRELKIAAHSEAFRRAVRLRLPFEIRDGIAVIGGKYHAAKDYVYVVSRQKMRALWAAKPVANALINTYGWERPNDTRN